MSDALGAVWRREGALHDKAGTWITRLRLSDVRSYAALSLDLPPGLIVLLGENGAGKTNLIEAVSLLGPGAGLRRTPLAEIARRGGSGGWSVHAGVATPSGVRSIGTGFTPRGEGSDRTGGRAVRIDGVSRSPAALAEIVEIAWITPAMDGLFTGPASERRRFLDRMTAAFDPGHRGRVSRFELAMRQRNRLLEQARGTAAGLEGFEIVLAETGVAIAAARLETVARLRAEIGSRQIERPASPFPAADVALEGRIEGLLAERPAVEAEDAYRALLAAMRERDRAAGRTLEGPHRSDLAVSHRGKAMPAALSSTGEQKALLVGLVLAHAQAVARSAPAGPPVLLLDEIAAHLDGERRAALFAEVAALGCQAFLTGTEAAPFAALEGAAHWLRVEAGRVTAGP